MAPAPDVGFAISPLPVTDGKIHDLEIVAGRSENQVEIAKRVQVAEIGAVPGDRLIALPAQDLGAAQSVLDALPQQPGECQAKEFVAQEVEESHGSAFHGIYQTHPVDEFALSGAPGFVESR